MNPLFYYGGNLLAVALSAAALFGMIVILARSAVRSTHTWKRGKE